MLFFIILFCFILSIFAIIYIMYGNYSQDSKGIKGFLCNHEEGALVISIIFTLLLGIFFGVSVVKISYNYINAPIEQAVCQETYNSLIYKSETEAIRDDFGIINKEYIDEVQAWNVEVVKMQEMTNNFWVGVYYPNWYNELETINLDNIEMKE